MADSQENPSGQGSPFSRPAFLAAGVLILVIVLLGVVVAVRVAGTSPGATTTPTPPSTAIPTSPSPSAFTDPSASVCGLPEAQGTQLSSPPAVTWAFQGTTPYPTSPELGPGRAAPEGYRFCFQHSPAGAAVMAANALAQGSDPKIGSRWAGYALGDGPYREELLDKIGTVTGAPDTRIKITGVRMLSYDGTSARVDLATSVSAQNQNLLMSAVYELAWQKGDWKISADVQRPLDTATIPDLSGYMPWGE